MPKQADCTIKGFEGHVILHDPLNVEQVFAIEQARDDAAQIEPSVFATKINEAANVTDADGKVIRASWTSRSDHAFLVAILKCVSEWHLANIPDRPTLDTFPMSPRNRAHELVDWLWTEVLKIYDGETAIPNA